MSANDVETNEEHLFSLPSVGTIVTIGVLTTISCVTMTRLEGWHGFLLFALALLIGTTILLEVELPWGGTVPLGSAIIIAFAELLPAEHFLLVVAAGLVISLPIQRQRHGMNHALMLFGFLSIASVTAVIAHRIVANNVDQLALGGPVEPKWILARVLVAGAAFITLDFFGRVRLMTPKHAAKVRIREAMPLHITLLCAAALLAIAERKSGVAAGFVAALPLLVTRFAFDRYSSARRTYEQTIQALSILPEVAGKVPLGHGERTAVYARALAQELGFAPDSVDRIGTAARLHSIGLISVAEPKDDDVVPNLDELGEVGADILRETGFLDDVADVVAETHTARSEIIGLGPAIVRVTSTFDELVGEDPARADSALTQLQAFHAKGSERRAAIELARLCLSRPDLPEQARRAGEPLTSVVAESSASKA